MFQWFVRQKYDCFLLLFACIFHQNSCFFKNRSKKPFFEVPSADLSSKARFFEPCWIPMGSKNDPWGGTFEPNGSQCSTPEVYRKHPGADYLQTMTFMRDFGSIWAHFYQFWVTLGRPWESIWDTFGNVLSQFAPSTSPTFWNHFEATVEPLHG